MIEINLSKRIAELGLWVGNLQQVSAEADNECMCNTVLNKSTGYNYYLAALAIFYLLL